MKLNGKDIKVGDKVRHINGKEGRVSDLVDTSEYPIRVVMDGNSYESNFFLNSTLIEKVSDAMHPIKMDDIPVRTGDDVYSLVHGWVKVKNVYDKYFVIEEKGGTSHSIMDGGKLARNSMRVVYWDEPKFTPPARPYKDVDVYQYLYRLKGAKKFNITVNHYHHQDVATTAVAFTHRNDFEFIKVEDSKITVKLTPQVEEKGYTLQ